MKGQKDMTPKDQSPRSEDIQYATGWHIGEWRRVTKSPRMNEVAGQSEYETQLLMSLVTKVKSDAAKNSTVWEPGILDPRIKENWMWSSRRW